MERDIIKRILIPIVAIVAVVGVSYMIGRRDGLNQAIRDSVRNVDTLFVFDTIVAEKPIFVDRIKLEKVPIPVTDTLRIHDTTYVFLQKEQVVWQDSLSRVYASGVMPQVDSVQHFIKERIVTIQTSVPVKKPCRWGIGVQAGYGVQIGEKIHAAPYVGIGVSYNLLSW